MSLFAKKQLFSVYSSIRNFINATNVQRQLEPGKVTKILACSFEVYGVVKDVSFREYTHIQANDLGVRGWCMTTSWDTVKGHIEGEPRVFEYMKNWLAHIGSPSSRIDKVVFGDTMELSKYTYEDFFIRY